MGSVSGWGTKIPHAMRQLRPCTVTKTQSSQKKTPKNPQITPHLHDSPAPSLSEHHLPEFCVKKETIWPLSIFFISGNEILWQPHLLEHSMTLLCLTLSIPPAFPCLLVNPSFHASRISVAPTSLFLTLQASGRGCGCGGLGGGEGRCSVSASPTVLSTF